MKGIHIKKDLTPKGVNVNRFMLRGVAAVLVLVAGASLLVSAPSAKYVTALNVSDSARVAKFSVDASSSATTTSFTMDTETTTAELPFTVKNESEVAVSYDIKLTVPSELKGVTPTLKNAAGTTLEATSVSTDKKNYTFEKASTLAVGGSTAQTANLTLVFTLDTSDTSTAETATYEGIQLDVVATQVD